MRWNARKLYFCKKMKEDHLTKLCYCFQRLCENSHKMKLNMLYRSCLVSQTDNLFNLFKVKMKLESLEANILWCCLKIYQQKMNQLFRKFEILLMWYTLVPKIMKLLIYTSTNTFKHDKKKWNWSLSTRDQIM